MSKNLTFFTRIIAEAHHSTVYHTYLCLYIFTRKDELSLLNTKKTKILS